MTTDEVIELHVKVHCAMIAAAGVEPAEIDKIACREALRALVRLAKIECLTGYAKDMDQASNAMKH
jgi:hypothetical protein